MHLLVVEALKLFNFETHDIIVVASRLFLNLGWTSKCGSIKLIRLKRPILSIDQFTVYYGSRPVAHVVVKDAQTFLAHTLDITDRLLTVLLQACLHDLVLLVHVRSSLAQLV